ncbi:MAG: drug/metabolite transporter (DMT)-like permease [Cognaticolwellia sp.]|jgi:drug/metabolite transporter (DMT)-like permease
MLNLILSIVSSTLIALVFKSFDRFEKIKLFPAIVVNYWVCAILGTAILGESPITETTFSEPWFPGAIMLGMFFIGTFYIIGLTISIFGVAISAVTQRMSLVIPVIFAFLYYQEDLTLIKGIGILLALLAVVLTNIKTKKEKLIKKSEKRNWFVWFLPIILFLVSGFVESVLQYLQRTYFDTSSGSQLPFTILLFGTAGAIGTIVLIINFIRNRSVINYESILGGIALGIPNLGSIYFLLKVLGEMEGSVVFPINNVAVIVLVGIIAFFAFKEKLTKINIFGIALAVLAILFVGVWG